MIVSFVVMTQNRFRYLVKNKTTPRNRDESEILGYHNAHYIVYDIYKHIILNQITSFKRLPHMGH